MTKKEIEKIIDGLTFTVRPTHFKRFKKKIVDIATIENNGVMLFDKVMAKTKGDEQSAMVSLILILSKMGVIKDEWEVEATGLECLAMFKAEED